MIWYDWSTAFDTLDITFSQATNPMFTQLAGPSITERFPLRWKDSVSVRLGYEKDLSACTTLRTGYVYHRNPIPAGTLTPFIPSTLEHVVALGLGRKFDGFNVDLGYQIGVAPTAHVGTSDLLGGDFSNSSTNATIHFAYISFSKML